MPASVETVAVARIARPIVSRFAALFVCWLLSPGLAFSQPANITLVNLNPGQLCVLGNQAGYGLTFGSGVWSWSNTVSTVTAQPAATGALIPTNPPSVSPFDSARLYLLIPPSNYPCSNITMALGSSQLAFAGSPPAIPYAIGEWSLDTSGLHIDFENVDNIQLPLMIEVSGANSIYSQIGNSVYSPHMSVQTAITGFAGNPSPFTTWLTNLNGSSAFNSLVQPAGPSHAAMIEGPTSYLQTAPLTDPLSTYFDTALTSLFSSSMNLLVMSDAASGFSEQAWNVTSDTASCPVYISGTPNAKSIQVTGTVQTTQSFVICNPVGSVVPFTSSMQGYPNWTAASCPPNAAANAPSVNCYVAITQTDFTTYQNYGGWYFGQPQALLPCVVSGSTCAQPTSGTITGIISKAQIYTSGSCPSASITGACIGFTVGPCNSQGDCPTPNASQSWAFSQIIAGSVSGGTITTLNVFESSGQMVFGGDGAFSSWLDFYISNSNLSTIAASVTRNINEALNRGIAGCNNLTMSSPPAACANATPSALVGFTPPQGCSLSAPTAPNCPSDAWWSNERNWYSSGGGIQNYYSQYIHTAQLTGNFVNGSACTQYSISPSTGAVQTTAINQCANIFLPPNYFVAQPPAGCYLAGIVTTPTGWSPSARGVPMGAAYGFAYDENPDYLAAQPAQVPSKFDPLPSCWPSITSFKMVIGRTAPLATHDFNGDSKSDIAWRDTSGNTAVWEMNGTAVLNQSSSFVANVAGQWAIVGQRDFNGDGYADLLWHDTSGNVAIWEMNGTTALNANSSFVGNVAPNWSIIGTGDFNADGLADILWQDSLGNVAIWEMNGTAVLNQNSSFVANVPAPWAIVGTGDFNGDGRADILWQDTSGNVAIWEMDGTTILNQSNSFVSNVPGPRSIAGTGDFNGDGMSDILWQDSSGNVAIWEMNGTAILNQSTSFVANVAGQWSIQLTGDFNGDGMSDILWHDTSGNVAIWEMNGTAILNQSTSFVGNVPGPWSIQHLAAD
jgi:hypothetical protein